MTVSYISSGAVVYSTASPAPVTPAHNVGDMLILTVGTKPDTTPATTPTGWTLLGAVSGGTGTTGIDTGPMRVGIFYRIADGTATDTTGAITVTGNNVTAAQVHVFRKTVGSSVWDIVGAGAADTTTGTAFTATMPVTLSLQPNDSLFAIGVIPTDVGAAAQFTAETVAAPGMTTVTMTEIAEWTTASGQDMGGWLARGTVVTGTATGPATVSATASGTTTNVAGPLYLVRLRDVIPNDPLSTFTEDFAGTLSKWATTTSASISAGSVSLSGIYELSTQPNYNMSESYYSFQVINASTRTGTNYADWMIAGTVDIGFILGSGTIPASPYFSISNVSQTITSVGTQPQTIEGRYFSVRVSGTTVTWYYSDDGATWIAFANAPLGAAAVSSAGKLTFTPSTTGTISYDNINIATTLPPVATTLTNVSASDGAAISVTSTTGVSATINASDTAAVSASDVSSNQAIIPGTPAGGSITHVSKAETVGAASTDTQIVANMPTGLVAGNTLVAFVASGGTAQTAPSGWTLRGSVVPSTAAQACIGVYYRTVTGSETSTYTWTFATAGRTSASVIQLSGVDTTTPFDVTNTSVGTANGAGASTVIPSITTVTANARVYSALSQNASTSTLTKPTEETLESALGNPGKTLGVAYEVMATAGATGTRTWTSSGTTDTAGVMVALRPAAGGGGTPDTYIKTATDTSAISVTATASVFEPAGATPITGSESNSVAVTESSSVSIITTNAVSASDTSAFTISEAAPTIVTGFATASQTLTWLWTGPPTTTDGFVSCKVSGGTAFRLRVSTSSDLMSNVVFGTSVGKDANSYVKMTATGLTPGTQYYYGVEIDGGIATRRGQFKTAPSGPANFAFTFASCNLTGITSSAYQSMLNRNPELFLHTGDLHYGDISTNDQAGFRSQYDQQFAKADAQDDLFASVPTAYTWSDHDFGSNNSNSTSASAPAAQAVYRQLVPTPTLNDAAGVYYSFTYGRVRFIITDNRSFKSPQANTDNSSKTILGATQKQWLKDQITNATEPMIFWVADVPWTDASAPDDEYANYNTERQELGTFIANSGKKVIYVHGDSHSMGANDGSTGSPGNIPTIAAAPIANLYSNKGTYTSGPYPTSGSGNIFQYGYATITDTGSSITMQFNGYDSTNTSRVSLTQTVNTPSQSNITGSETSAVSVSESSAVLKQITASDSASVSVAETTSVFKQVVASDSASVSVSDISNVGSTMPGTDSAAVSIADTSVVAVTQGSGDTGSISVADTAATIVSTTAADTASIAVAEVTALVKTIVASDTTAVSVVEASSSASTLAGTDSASITINDVSAVAKSVTASDSAAITITENSNNGSSSLGTESSSIGITDTSTVFITSTTTDTSSIAVTESNTRTLAFASTDTGAVTITETSSVFADDGRSASDTAAISVTETRAIAKTSATTDTSAVSVTESSAVFKQVPASDTASIAISEVSGLGSTQPGIDNVSVGVSESTNIAVTASTDDTGSVAVDEVSDIDSTIVTSDTSAVAVGETVGTVNSFTAADTSSIAGSESVSLNKNVVGTESNALVITESRALSIFNAFSTSDTGSVAVTETAGTFFVAPGQDTSALVVSETSSLATSGGANIPAADTGSVAVTESSSIAISLSRGDTGAVAVSESTSSVKTLTASDTSSIAVAESRLQDARFTRTDTGSIAVSESVSFQQVPISASDAGSLGVTEQVTILNVWPGGEVVSIAVTESSSINITGTIAKSASDTGSIAVSEGTTKNLFLTRTDTGSIHIAEQVQTIVVTNATSDVETVGVDESVNIEVSVTSTDQNVIGLFEDAFKAGSEGLEFKYTSDGAALSVSELIKLIILKPGQGVSFARVAVTKTSFASNSDHAIMSISSEHERKSGFE